MSSPPTTIGKYQIIREIARSNDIVYEAWDPLMNRRVAVKEMAVPKGLSDQQKEDRINRFRREARAAGSLTHPNIMTVFEVGEEAGRHFIAMEYLDGHTLRNEIDTKGFLPQDQSVEIASAVLKGLAYAHENGVIHRDIKPDNVQLLSDGRIKITDFGIARLTFEPNLTQDGQVFGTPSYMSPEQIVGRDIDARSDIFSVGVMLYEMIAGKKPFAGDSVVSITYAIMNKEAERPQQANYALWRVIERALDKSPQLRHANAVEMLQALDSASKAVSPDGVINMSPQLGGTVIQPGQGGMLPPVINPYVQPGYGYQQPQYPVQPYPQMPQGNPLPVYDPYGHPAAGAASPYTPSYGQQPGQMPLYQPPDPYAANAYQPPSAQVYYPPPPRRPLFEFTIKPETKYFLGRLFLGILIGGTGIALLIGIISVGVKVFSTPAILSQSGQPSAGTAEERLNAERKKFDALEPGEEQKKTGLELGKAYLAAGNQALSNGDENAAVRAFQNSIEVSPQPAAAHEALANYYLNKAKQVGGDDHWRWLENAANSFGEAADAEPEAGKSQLYQQKTVDLYIQLVQRFADSQKPEDRALQRSYLENARRHTRDADLLARLNATERPVR